MNTTPLRQRMTENMQLRGLAPKTQKAYVGAVSNLAKFYEKSPDLLSSEEVRTYVSSQKVAGNSEGAPRPTAGDEPCGFTPRGEGGRVPPFIEKIRTYLLHLVRKVKMPANSFRPCLAGIRFLFEKTYLLNNSG